MAKKKSSKKPKPKKKNLTVAKTFKCLFCAVDGAVSCSLDFNVMVGELKCRVCEHKFQTTINDLSEPVDVFSEWLDETAELQQKENKKRSMTHPLGMNRNELNNDNYKRAKENDDGAVDEANDEDDEGLFADDDDD